MYGWIPGASSSLQSTSIRAEGMISLRNADNSVESAELGSGWEFHTKAGWGGHFSYRFLREGLQEWLEFSDEVNVPPGDYSFSGFRGFFHAPMGGLLGAMPMLGIGSFYRGWETTLRIMPNWSGLPDLN